MAWYDINNYISPETINEIAREHWIETCLRPIIYFITDPVLKWLLDSWDPRSLLSTVAFVVAFSAFFVLLVVGLVQLGYCWYVVNRWLSDWTVKFLREKVSYESPEHKDIYSYVISYTSSFIVQRRSL